MASLTDVVVEGLKYPFTDIKKVLSLGALFAVINALSFAILNIVIDIFRHIALIPGNSIAFKFSHLQGNDIYIIIALAVISFIISLVIMGYEYRVLKFSIDENDKLPGFNNILNILINGFKYFIASLVYNIIPIIVLIGGIELLHFQYSDYIVAIIALIFFIICNFLLIMGLANMVDSGKLKKAFDLKEIFCKISNLGWAKYVGIVLFTCIVYAIIMAFVGVVFMIISAPLSLVIKPAFAVSVIMSIIEGLLISPYVTIFFNRVYGSIYKKTGRCVK